METGRALAARNIGLVYGGAKVGLMGAVADACLESGGRVIGVIPHVLVDKEVSHNGCTELHVVDTMHTRKALMGEKSDAFLILPGGYGTFEELFEVLADLRAVGCDTLTLGQYLAPTLKHVPVARFVSPAEFDSLAELARTMGFSKVVAGPFVRSSYHADEMVETHAHAGHPT